MSDSEAENALDKILNTIGASKNFVLTPCSEINNAAATSYKGIRYILYDKEFMQLINSKTNDWASLAILAHEVGHHINGHSVDVLLLAADVVETKSLENKRKQELEADEFAGFVLARLGATSNEALAFTELLQEKDDTYDTHPTKSKRVASVIKGYTKAGGNSRQNNDYVADNSTMSVEEYFNIGIQKIESQDYFGAIEDFNVALRIKPDYSYALFKRAYAKYELKDYYGAIADIDNFIELEPDVAEAYANRGLAKSQQKDYYGAIADYTKAIELNPDYAGAYYSRASEKYDLKDYYGAIVDYTKAIELNPDYTNAYINRGLAKTQQKDYYGAIADYTKAIELNPDVAEAYANRGFSKYYLGDKNGACADVRKAISLGFSDYQNFIRSECN